VVAVIYYQFDDDLIPEAVKVINYTPKAIEPKDNGYYHLLGLFSEKDKDPVVKGQEIIQQAKVLYQAHKDSQSGILFLEDIKEARVVIPDVSHELCSSIDRACINDAKNRISDFKKVSEENKLLIERYRQVYQFDQYRETILVTPSTDILKIHKIALTDIALKWVKGEKESALMLLERDLRFQKIVLASDISLITKMITIAMVGRNLRLLSEFISDCQDCNAVELNRTSFDQPFSRSELSLRKTFNYEYRLAHSLLANLSQDEGNQDLLYTLFYKENSTLNIFFKQFQGIVELSECDHDSFLKCQSEYLLIANKGVDYFSWQFIKDPVGSIYVGISQPAYNGYARTVFLTELQRRLVVVKNLIHKNKIPKDGIQVYLNRLPASLRNPFTGGVIKWDSEQNLLTMDMEGDEDYEVSVEL